MPASGVSSDFGLRIRVAPEGVTLRHWPLRDRGWSAWLPILAAGVLGVVSAWATGSAALGWLIAGILMLTSWRNWLPITFEIGPSGVTQVVLWRRRRIPWTSILQYQIGLRGVLLLPDPVVSRLSPLRGVYLHWGKHRREVLANFDYYLQSWATGRSPRRDSTQAQSLQR